jgi:phosphatidyl-myo-inositol dimannoside synthase
MKVLLLAPPLGRAGGIQRYTAMLEQALEDLLSAENVRCVAVEDNTGGVAPRHFTGRTKLRFALRAWRRSGGWRPDLIICTHLALGPIGWLLARLNQGRCWIVVHGIEGWKRLPYWKRRALYRADRVLTTSSFNREQVMRSQRLMPERMLSLPCAVDNHLLKLEPSSKNGLYRGLLSGRRLILTVARLAGSERYKGHEVVLQALPSVIAQVPELTYLIVGEGDDRPRLEKLADELGLANSVVFTGKVSDAELAAFYRASEVFVLPGRTIVDSGEPKGEGFGIVYLEAMAFGLPVIGPDYGAPTEIIRNGLHGFLVDPGDPWAVARALLRLLGDPEGARRMGAAASEWVRGKYSYLSFRERLQGILTSAVPEFEQARVQGQPC